MASSRKDNKGRVLHKGESQRKDGTYMYRYTDMFGKRQTIYSNTIKELRIKEREVVVKTELRMNMSPSTTTIMDLIDKQAGLFKKRRASTQKQRERDIKLLSKYPIATMPIRQITTTAAKTWLIEMSDEGYATNTIKNILGLVKTSCKNGVHDGDIYLNPFDFKLDFLPPKNTRQALTKEEQDNILGFLGANQKYELYYYHVVALIETGLRIGEFGGLIEQDIDMKNRIIHVRRQVQGFHLKELYVSKPKTDAGIRDIPMSNAAYEAFDYLIQHYIKHAKPMAPIDGLQNFIIRGKRGTYITPRAFSHYYNTFCNAYNKQHDQPIYVTPHVLRHTFCTNLAHAGVSWPSIQYLMGHATLDTTVKVYTHNDRETAISEMLNLSKKSYRISPDFYTNFYTNFDRFA